MRRSFFILATAVSWASVSVLSARDARADGVAVRLDLVEPGEIKLDGIPREWPSVMTALSKTVSGAGPGTNLGMRGALAYDDANVYVAADVTDEHLARTPACSEKEDHASLVLAFPEVAGGYALHEIDLFPGVPGRMAGCVKWKGASSVSGAKIIEAPKPVPGGYTFEAVIPWSAFPEGARTRVGLRGTLRYYDSGSGASRNVIGTSTDVAPTDLPRLPVESEQSLDEGLLQEKKLTGAPKHDKIADVGGDAMNERVLVYDRFLVILGPHYRGGKEYFFADMGLDVGAGHLVSFEVRDVNGDGKADIVMKKRFGTAAASREMVEVLALNADGVPNPIFRHEIGIVSPTGQIMNDVRFSSEGAHPTVEILAGSAKGYAPENYREAVETTMDPLLLPWGKVKSQTYQWNGNTFTKTHEDEQAPRSGRALAGARHRGSRGGSAAAALVPQPPPPRPPNADELQDQVYALYKRERRVSGAEKPRFDFAVDVAEDERAERVVIHGKDLVVFGKGFKSGTGFAYINLQQFADPRDIVDATARDLTNDGKAEILVRGLIHVPLPKEPGSKSKTVTVVDRELLLIYTVGPQAITRVFGAETGRALGDQRIAGFLNFSPGARGIDIEIRPGHAFGWAENTYPFDQDKTPVGGMEPLLLPWGGAAPVRYHWDGAAFSR